MKKVPWLVGTLTIVALLLTGCAGEPAKQSTSPGQEAPKAPAAAAPAKAPAAAPAAQSARPRQLVIASDLTLVQLDPARAFEDAYLPFGKAMYDQLTQLDPAKPGKIDPQLAERWDISGDGLAYTFYLRKGVKFSTGREMTSADVKFSLERLQNIKGSPSFLMAGVKEVEATDPYTVRFRLDKADATFLPRTSGIYMAIIDSQEAKAHGAESGPGADKSDQAKAWLDDHSIGTGAYVLERWERNAELRLKANPDHWRGKPAFDSVVVKAVQDPTTQAQMLQRGDVDVAMNIDPDRANDLRKAPGIAIEQGLSPTILFLAMTANKDVSAVVANQKFRQAVALAIDHNGITEQLLAGNAVTPPSILPVGFLAADTVPLVKRDLAKAKALLAEAGYAGGIKVPLNFPNAVQNGVDINVLAQKVQADLAEIGITIEPIPQASTVFLDGYRNGKNAMSIARWTPDFPDPDANAGAYGPSTGIISKRIFYSNRDNDTLVVQALGVTDPEARKAIYAKLLKNIQEDANYVPLVQPKENLAYRTDIQGLKYHPVVKVPIIDLTRK